MEVLRAKWGVKGFDLQTLVQIGSQGEASLQTGTVFLGAGRRQPASGSSMHEQHEISLILEGEIELQTAAGVRRVGVGEVVHLAPREAHVATALTDSRIYFALFGAPDTAR